MCGIVGVVGKLNATKVLLNGLAKLEYRGYDSAGIFVNDQGHEAVLIKRVGRIKNLQAAVPDTLTGTLGIGHTRWATNGKPLKPTHTPTFLTMDASTSCTTGC